MKFILHSNTQNNVSHYEAPFNIVGLNFQRGVSHSESCIRCLIVTQIIYGIIRATQDQF
jgi:hypothetical protein